jgi:hypothetical protein
MLSVRTQKAIQRCLSFASKSDFQDLHTYFQIPEVIQKDHLETSLNIWIEPTDILGVYILVLHQVTAHLADAAKVPLKAVPEDIERLIYGFFVESNTIRIQMELTNDFPIRPPKFTLLTATKGGTKIQKVTHQMNCDLYSEYSPALAIEKTLLILLSRLLNKLEYI